MTTTTAEQWRVIRGNPGYRISDLGRVRTPDGRILKSRRLPTGFWIATHRSGSQRLTFTLHLVVLEAFVAPRERGFKAVFLDGNKDNYALDNLDWFLTHEGREELAA